MKIEIDVRVRDFRVILNAEESDRHFKFVHNALLEGYYYRSSACGSCSGDDRGLFYHVFVIDERIADDYIEVIKGES